MSSARFAEKYLLARETSAKANPKGGTSGYEIELNVLDHDFKPVLTVGTGPDQRSFVDYFFAHHVPGWLQDRAQREVFHWMIEWATRPYYSVIGTIYEQRLLEASVINGLAAAGQSYWRVTAKPDATKYVVTSQNPLYAPVYPENGLAQTGYNFCVSQGTNAVIILPESGAAASSMTST